MEKLGKVLKLINGKNENNTMQKQIKQINKELKRERNKTIITGVAAQ